MKVRLDAAGTFLVERLSHSVRDSMRKNRQSEHDRWHGPRRDSPAMAASQAGDS